MLTQRTTLLTALGMLGAHLTTAQTTASASAPTGTDMLFWLLRGILGIVLIVVLVTGGAMASAVARRAPHSTDSATTQPTTHTEEGVAQC